MISNMSAVCLEGEPIMNAAHGFQTHVWWGQSVTLRFKMNSFLCRSLCFLWEWGGMIAEKHTEPLLTCFSQPLVRFWRFCCGRHIKVDLSRQPSSNKWNSFFFHLFLSCLSDLSSLRASPASRVHSWKPYLTGFNAWMLTYCDPHFSILPVTLSSKLTTSLSRDWQMLAHKHTRLMQPPSLNFKTQLKVCCVYSETLTTDLDRKALIYCAV